MYKEISSNKRKTWFLVSGFSIIIVGLFLAFAYASDVDPFVALTIGLTFSIIYSLISFYFADKAVLLTHKAKQIDKKTGREIYLLVENLTIATGVPMPKVYIIDEPVPNAFATGRDPEHASIVFTTGILSKLDKLELEGVIAHELSHIKNYDIRLMTTIVVLVGLIALMADIMIRIGLRSGARRKMPWPVIIAALVLAGLSPFIAQAIKLAVSRTREYLADASGVLMTRHPEALASALKKIRDHEGKMQSANHATAHLFLASPFGEKRGTKQKFFTRLFATHPPIDERISRLQSMGQ